RRSGRIGQQALQCAPIDVLERLQCIEPDLFVGLVDRRVDGAELNDLWTNLCDEATVRGAAGRRQLRLYPSLVGDRLLQGGAQRALPGEEGQAADGPVQRIVQAM